MADVQPRWVPGLGSRLANLKAQLSAQNKDRGELRVPDLPVESYVGADVDGSIWLRITCDPSRVSTDDLSAAVAIDPSNTGYRVMVSATTADTVAIRFLEEVVQLIDAGHPPGDAGRMALQSWRELLARPPGSPLSEKALVGLFGELEVLATILRHGGELDQWTGWNRDHADFRLPGLVIEVKSTTSADYRRVTIHGLAQLADPEDGSDLILVLRRLEVSPTGTSLPDLTEEIVRLGASRAVLLDRLSRVGYSEQHRGRYEQLRFVSQEVALRSVDGGHPRLVADMLEGIDLSCIDKVTYELNLNGEADADLDTTLADLVEKHLRTTA